MTFIEEEIKLFKKQFNYASFTWNGDNATGVKIAKRQKRMVQSFLAASHTRYKEKIREEIQRLTIDPSDFPLDSEVWSEAKTHNQALADLLAFIDKE